MGTIGLIKAIDRFDLDYGVEFVTFGRSSARSSALLPRHQLVGTVPPRLQELGLSLAKANDALDGVEYFNSLKPLMAELTERERLILSLRLGQELNQTQIGAQLGLSHHQQVVADPPYRPGPTFGLARGHPRRWGMRGWAITSPKTAASPAFLGVDEDYRPAAGTGGEIDLLLRPAQKIDDAEEVPGQPPEQCADHQPPDRLAHHYGKADAAPSPRSPLENVPILSATSRRMCAPEGTVHLLVVRKGESNSQKSGSPLTDVDAPPVSTGQASARLRLQGRSPHKNREPDGGERSAVGVFAAYTRAV